MDYWEIAKPTYIENWPRELCSRSFAQKDIPLTVQDAIALGSNVLVHDGYGEAFAPAPLPIDHIEKAIQEAISVFPKGNFSRLGSRSPKDSFYGYNHGFRVFKAHEVLSLFTDSERIFEDLLIAVKQDYAPYIFLRDWVDIPEWSEFRCFMKDRKLVGISQYQYLQDATFPEITEHAASIKWAIDKFFEWFKVASHLDDVVFDVWADIHVDGNSVSTEIKLVEINPFFNMTDPCLFDWRKGGDFDGSFRYRK